MSNRQVAWGMIVVMAAVAFGAWSAAAQEAEKPSGWKVSLALGFNMTQGNSETIVGTASLTGDLEAGANLVRLGAEGAYGEAEIEDDAGETDDEVTTRNAKAFGSYKRKFKRAYGYVDGSVMQDKIAEVDYRGILGGGIGYFLFDGAKVKLGTEGGLSYPWEEVDGVEDDYPAYRLAERGEWQITKTSKLWESVEYLPKTDDFDNYLLNGEVGAEAALATRLSLRVVYQIRYDNEPAPDQEEQDTILISALSWQI